MAGCVKATHNRCRSDKSRARSDTLRGHARDAGEPITAVYQNYLDLDYTEQFDVVTLINRDFGTLIPNKRDIVLEKTFVYGECNAELERQEVIISRVGDTKVFHNWLTYYDESEVAQMLVAEGFEVVETNPFLSAEAYDDPTLYLGCIASIR